MFFNEKDLEVRHLGAYLIMGKMPNGKWEYFSSEEKYREAYINALYAMVDKR